MKSYIPRKGKKILSDNIVYTISNKRKKYTFTNSELCSKQFYTHAAVC